MGSAASNIREWNSPTPQAFRDEIMPLGEPAILRQIVPDWPLVAAAKVDPHVAMTMLSQNANGRFTSVLRAEPEVEGRFHYGPDGVSMNFIRGEGNLAGVIAGIRELERSERPFSIAAQSMTADKFVPGFSVAHPMPWVPIGVEPKLWIGNAAKVATHHDPHENMAVVAAGRRRFTLFPPSAEPDLYMGPHDPTPAGPRISMVHVTAPDLDLYPRFADAQKVAQVGQLEPGDAIYIPILWYHHVEALDRFNVLVNYWWNEKSAHAA